MGKMRLFVGETLDNAVEVPLKALIPERIQFVDNEWGPDGVYGKENMRQMVARLRDIKAQNGALSRQNTSEEK